ncbi:MAG: DPP IV N-terminal domain-containing protein [Saprospiraceae bacterium]|nr:DPP IV N-terminal domain-containing protein [Saprospiraceae bacterium]
MKILKLVILVILVNQLIAQEVDTESRLNLERIFKSGDFRQDRFGPHKWLAGGEFYTTVEYNSDGNTELILYDSKTGSRQILVDDESLEDPGTGTRVVIEDYSWSSDEKKLLIFTNSQRVWRTNTRGDFYFFDLETKILKQLGSNRPAASLMFAKFNPSGTRVAYVSENNLFLEDLVSNEIRQLTQDGTEDIINGTFDWAYEEEFFCKDGFRWSPDGNSIAFWQIDATDTKDFFLINNTDDVYSQIIPIQYPKVGQKPSGAKVGILEISSGNTAWINLPGDPDDNYIPRIQWLSPVNTLLITQLSRRQNQLNLWSVDVKDNVPTKIYEEKSETWIDIVNIDVSAAWEMEDQIVLNQGKSFLRLSEKDGWRHLYLTGLDKTSELVSPGEFDIASVKGINEAGDLVYIIASPENATQRYLYALNLKSKKIERLTPEIYEGLNLYDISPNGRYAYFRTQSAQEPAKGFMITLPDHEITDTLFTNEHFRKSLSKLDMPAVDFFQITTADGITLDGKIIKPSDFSETHKYPLLFYVYGEPAAQTAVDRMDNLWHYFLAQKGYLIVTLDNRGTPSLKGADWRKSIYRKVGIVNARDQALAAEEILKWPFVDTSRVGVWGWSGGGAMTLNLLFKYPGIYKMGIAVAAVTNQLLYDNIYQERYMGLPEDNFEDFISGSPATYTSGLQGDLLYIHGTGDDNVHYQNAEVLINALIKENKHFDLMIYPNRTHGIYEGENTTMHLYGTMTKYLDEHLLKAE